MISLLIQAPSEDVLKITPYRPGFPLTYLAVFILVAIAAIAETVYMVYLVYRAWKGGVLTRELQIILTSLFLLGAFVILIKISPVLSLATIFVILTVAIVLLRNSLKGITTR